MSLLLLLLVCAAGAAAQRLELPVIFASNMVLQRNAANSIWGWSDPGQQVTVAVRGQQYPATAGADGIFRVALPASAPTAAPFTIAVTAGAASLTLTNVVYGDVFVCSGQSNMGIVVSQAVNGSEEAATANYPDIRIFAVATLDAYDNVTVPQNNLTASIPWSPVTPNGAIQWFSALCYFTGRDLYLAGESPAIGLIQSCWGGTAIQVWMSPEALHKCDGADNAPPKGTPRRLAAVPSVNSTLFNAMISPLLSLAIKGALWDQGESNVGQPVAYVCLLSSMIADWRQKWNQQAAAPFNPEFPFVYRQLQAYPSGGYLGPMRLTMEAVLNTPVTAMITSYDLADMASAVGNIHFQQKQEAGRRMALALQVIGYGQKKFYTGPVATNLTVVDYGSGDLKKFAAIVKFVGVNDANPLQLASNSPPNHGIEILGGAGPGVEPNSNWMPVYASLVDSSTLMVNVSFDGSQTAANPTALRYAWSDVPPLGLWDTYKLPSWPFYFDIPPPDRDI